ncbi:hypothetical protein GCM10009741_77000 [Kribbella lupini]|uniref:Uncharacterized protein n=1 Tax=Kribbella lupini TaxID=291602 RepID=A0ABN2CL16_9ACTN
MDPIFVSIAAAIAAKGAGGLYDLVKRKFGKEPEALKAWRQPRRARQTRRPSGCSPNGWT